MESFEVESKMWKPDSPQNIQQIRRWDLFEVVFDKVRMQLQVFSLVAINSIQSFHSLLLTILCYAMHGHIMQWPPRAADSSIVIVHHGAFSLLVSCPLTLCWGDSASFDNPAIGHQLLQKRQPFLSCRRTTWEAQVGINWKGNTEWRKENHKTEKRFAEV